MKTLVIAFILVNLFSLIKPTHASSGNQFSPYVSLLSIYDDNFFRVDKQDLATIGMLGGEEKLSDTVLVYIAGLNVDLNLFRQNLIINAELNKYKFVKNVDFNNDNAQYSVSWGWALTNRLYGNLMHSYEENLASFENNQSLALGGNKQIKEISGLSGNWKFLQNFAIGFECSETDSAFQDSITNTKSNIIFDNKKEVKFEYVDRKYNKIGIKLSKKVIKNSFENNITAFLTSIENTIEQIVFTTDLNFSNKSKFAGQIGKEILKDDFDATSSHYWNGKVSYLWSISDSFQLESQVYREIQRSDNNLINLEQIEGVNVSFNWLLTSKSYIKSSFEFDKRLRSNQRFGNNLLNDSFDELNRLANFSYFFEPSRFISVNASYEYLARDTSKLNRNFNSKMLSISITIKG